MPRIKKETPETPAEVDVINPPVMADGDLPVPADVKVKEGVRPPAPDGVKKRGRPAGSAGAKSGAPTKAQLTSASAATTHLIEFTCTSVFGEEWKMGDDEKLEFMAAWHAYYASKGKVPELPPSILIGVVFVGYGAKRLNKPETKTRMGKFKKVIAYLTEKWQAKKDAKKAAKEKAEETAQ